MRFTLIAFVVTVVVAVPCFARNVPWCDGFTPYQCYCSIEAIVDPPTADVCVTYIDEEVLASQDNIIACCSDNTRRFRVSINANTTTTTPIHVTIRGGWSYTTQQLAWLRVSGNMPNAPLLLTVVGMPRTDLRSTNPPFDSVAVDVLEVTEGSNVHVVLVDALISQFQEIRVGGVQGFTIQQRLPYNGLEFGPFTGNLVVDGIAPQGGTTGIVSLDTQGYGEWRGTVRVRNGPIRSLLVNENFSMRPTEIFVENNDILRLDATKILAPAAGPGSITARKIDTLRTRSGPMIAHITANEIGEILGSAGGALGIEAAGEFTGSITTSSVSTGIAVPSATGAANALTAGSIVKMGTLAVDAAISLPANGLKGQVIINKDNSTGQWNGSVQVNGTTLSPIPYYAQPSSALGGGAVGLAPFHLYQPDCQPPHNQTSTGQGILESVFVPPSAPTTTPVAVRIRHYGPIQLAAGMTWANAVSFELQPVNAQGVQCGEWREVANLFKVNGSGDTGWDDPRGWVCPANPTPFPAPASTA